MHDRTQAILDAATAFVAEAAARTPPLIAGLSRWAGRDGKVWSHEIATMRADRDQATSALGRGDTILVQLEDARQALVDAALRAGRMDYDDTPLETAADHVTSAMQPWRAIASTLRGWVDQAEAVNWTNGG